MHFESCKVSLLTQGGMERHLRDHMPAASRPAEDLKGRSDNLLEHRHMPVLNEGKQTSRSWHKSWFFWSFGDRTSLSVRYVVERVGSLVQQVTKVVKSPLS